MEYINRIVDSELENLLASSGAVVIEGTKACGKTATARQCCASEVLLDVDDNARLAIAVAPSTVLEGLTPRLIDEWQIEPDVWNHIRRAVDDRRVPGQFILTGSVTPADDVVRHTGAGRLTRLRMRTMSLYETGHATGIVSLAELLNGVTVASSDPGLTIENLGDCIIAGGWPANLGRRVDQATHYVRSYLDEIRRVDIQQVDGVKRDVQRMARVLQSLARNVATEVTNATLSRDVGGAEDPLKNDTISEYLHALERLMIIEDQPAWAPHLRSKSRLRTSPKRHYADPSLAVAALGAKSSDRLLQDLKLFGLLFESLAIRDLRIYAQAADAQVLHYRDNTGLEVDAVVETADGRWVALEIKLGGDKAIENAAANLLRFGERIDTTKSGKPASLAIITATGYGYVRKDGITVLPIGALGP